MQPHRLSRFARHATFSLIAFGSLAVSAPRVAAQYASVLPTPPRTAGGTLAPRSPGSSDIQRALDAAYAKYKSLKEGKNADYIPALAKVDPNLFGIALVTADGQLFVVGDTATEVSIQSISKVFTLARVLQDSGDAAVVRNIGVDATGMPFNSIIAIEQKKGAEQNPFVNPGAITATSMVGGTSATDIWQRILDTYDGFAGRKLRVLDDVYQSEAATNQRNRAIAALMYAYGHISGNPEQATDIYTRQCSVGVNARDLAIMAATLANNGVNPISKQQMLSPRHVPGLLAVMSTAGLYDDSGQWLFKTGLPAKSGVGGGLIAVSPGNWGIAVISPPLDEAGNSVRAQRAIADISAALGGNPYAVVRTGTAAGQVVPPPHD
ncbi:MAG TPA: glutaminase A [Gemmatimonadaceae bacterium]|jgi:glutaminase|nr:glutaminase A [Gemmatimonadaceae bacterium]